MTTTKRKVAMPTIKEVAAELRAEKPYIEDSFDDGEGNVGIDVRLQVLPSGAWALRAGDSSYDYDHRGFWGSGFLARQTNCRELARELIDQCAEHAAQCGDD